MTDYDITDIEKLVADTVRSLGVSTHVWNNRPKATDDSISEFVVVKVTGGITDKAAYGQTRVAVHLFARDVKEMKNSAKLSVMQKALESLPTWIEPTDPNQGHGLLLDGHPRIVGDTPDDFGFHARIITFRLFVKAV
jgi:hypothetical protein